MIFNGRTFAKERMRVLQETRQLFGLLSLGIIVGSADPVTLSYVRIKEKTAQALDVQLVRYEVIDSHTTDDVVALVHEASKMNQGVVVQLPLGFSHDLTCVINAIPLGRDIDVISEHANALFTQGSHVIMPPVASAINEIIDAFDIEVSKKRVVVIGRGALVGKPASVLFTLRGADVVTLTKGDPLEPFTRDADIIVLGAGVPGIVTGDMVKEGVVIFDAGTSESDGAIVGDADQSVIEKASFFTPVPGGIGPVAVVEIFANLLTLAGAPHA